MEDEDEFEFELTPLDRFGKFTGLSVTNLSAQLWCEKQYELEMIHKLRRETEAMRLGTKRHEELEELDHEIMLFEADTKEEIFALKLVNTAVLLEQLIESGKSRELWVCGFLDGIFFRGIIDELRLEPLESNSNFKSSTMKLIISDTKTRQKPTLPSQAQKNSAIIQLQTYHVLLQTLISSGVESFAETALQTMGYDPDFVLKEWPLNILGSTLREAFINYGNKFQKLPLPSDDLELVYEHQKVEIGRTIVKFEPRGVYFTLDDLLSYWRGSRPAEPCSEVFKCRFCHVIDKCDVSFLDKEEKKILSEKAIAVRQEEEKLNTEQRSSQVEEKGNQHSDGQKQQILNSSSYNSKSKICPPVDIENLISDDAILKSQSISAETIDFNSSLGTKSLTEMKNTKHEEKDGNAELKTKYSKRVAVAVPAVSSPFYDCTLVNENLKSQRDMKKQQLSKKNDKTSDTHKLIKKNENIASDAVGADLNFKNEQTHSSFSFSLESTQLTIHPSRKIDNDSTLRQHLHSPKPSSQSLGKTEDDNTFEFQIILDDAAPTGPSHQKFNGLSDNSNISSSHLAVTSTSPPRSLFSHANLNTASSLSLEKGKTDFANCSGSLESNSNAFRSDSNFLSPLEEFFVIDFESEEELSVINTTHHQKKQENIDQMIGEEENFSIVSSSSSCVSALLDCKTPMENSDSKQKNFIYYIDNQQPQSEIFIENCKNGGDQHTKGLKPRLEIQMTEFDDNPQSASIFSANTISPSSTSRHAQQTIPQQRQRSFQLDHRVSLSRLRPFARTGSNNHLDANNVDEAGGVTVVRSASASTTPGTTAYASSSSIRTVNSGGALTSPSFTSVLSASSFMDSAILLKEVDSYNASSTDRSSAKNFDTASSKIERQDELGAKRSLSVILQNQQEAFSKHRNNTYSENPPRKVTSSRTSDHYADNNGYNQKKYKKIDNLMSPFRSRPFSTNFDEARRVSTCSKTSSEQFASKNENTAIPPSYESLSNSTTQEEDNLGK